jgi:hypothetical protein
LPIPEPFICDEGGIEGGTVEIDVGAIMKGLGGRTIITIVDGS